MRAIALTALAIVSLAARSEASCIDVVYSCYCQASQRIGLVVTEHVDGGTAALRVQSSPRGLIVDAGLTLPAWGSETPGERWLLRDERRYPIDAEGKVQCEQLPGPRIPAETAVSAAVSETCREEIEAAGFRQPPCNDTPGCSSAPLALLPLLASAWLLRRRLR